MTQEEAVDEQRVREALAALCHEQWSGWMDYLYAHSWDSHGDTVINRDCDIRWRRQLATPYELLSEREKDSDRKEADRILAVLAPFLAAREAMAKAEAWEEAARIAGESCDGTGTCRDAIVANAAALRAAAGRKA